MSVQIGEANVVNKIHSMPWLKSPKVSENMESKNASNEHRDSTNGTPDKEEPSDNNNASNNAVKKKSLRRNSKNRGSQSIQDRRKGEKIVKTSNSWADDTVSTPQENQTKPVQNAWGSNANTAQALFPQAEDSKDSKVPKKEAEDIDKAIVESVCTMQKEDLQRDFVKKNSLEQQPPPQKVESEEDDWSKPKHNLADPPSNTNDNNNNEGKNRNFTSDQFGSQAVDGHERHVFTGKRGRRRDNEFVKSHTDSRPRQSSSQSDYGSQKFPSSSHVSPDRTSSRGERPIRKDSRFDEQSHFRGNRNPRQLSRNFGYQGHRNGNYYSNTRDNRNQSSHPRPKDSEPPKTEESPKKQVEEPEPAQPAQVEETKEPPKEDPEVSNSKLDPPAMDNSQTPIDIHHSTPNTTSTPEPLKELENEFHRVNLNTEADYQVQQPQVPTMPTYSELPYNATPMQYVDMNSYSQPIYSAQPYGATQTLPHYDYTCTYPSNHHQYSTNLAMANFGLGMVPVVSLPSLDMSAPVEHTQFLNEEVARIQNHICNLRTQLISAHASLYTAQLKFYQHQAHTRSQPPLNPPTHHHHHPVPHNPGTSQVPGINAANKYVGIPPGFQKTNTGNFDLPKTYPNLYANHSSASSDTSAHNHPHHSNNGLRNYNNLSHIRGKVNGYTGTEGLTQQGRRYQ